MEQRTIPEILFSFSEFMFYPDVIIDKFLEYFFLFSPLFFDSLVHKLASSCSLYISLQSESYMSRKKVPDGLNQCHTERRTDPDF